MESELQPSASIQPPKSQVDNLAEFDQTIDQETAGALAKITRLKTLILTFLGPILLVIWLKVRLGLWWPEVQFINQFWKNPSWIFTGQFLLGWWVGWLILKLDQQNSKAWYQSPPLTRSVSFCLTLLALGIFVMTSTDSWLGIALILSLWSQITAEVFIWQSNPRVLAETFLHDVQPNFRLKLAESLNNKWGQLMLAGMILLILVGLV